MNITHVVTNRPYIDILVLSLITNITFDESNLYLDILRNTVSGFDTVFGSIDNMDSKRLLVQ